MDSRNVGLRNTMWKSIHVEGTGDKGPGTRDAQGHHGNGAAPAGLQRDGLGRRRDTPDSNSK